MGLALRLIADQTAGLNPKFKGPTPNLWHRRAGYGGVPLSEGTTTTKKFLPRLGGNPIRGCPWVPHESADRQAMGNPPAGIGRWSREKIILRDNAQVPDSL